MTEHRLVGIHVRAGVHGTGHGHQRAVRREGGRLVGWWRCDVSGGECPDRVERQPPLPAPPCRNGHPATQRFTSRSGRLVCHQCQRDAGQRTALVKRARAIADRIMASALAT